MSYELEFEEHALKEFKKLGAPLREQFKKKLKKDFGQSSYSRQSAQRHA